MGRYAHQQIEGGLAPLKNNLAGPALYPLKLLLGVKRDVPLLHSMPMTALPVSGPALGMGLSSGV